MFGRQTTDILLPQPPEYVEKGSYIACYLVDQMPKVLRDAVNYMPAGIEPQTVVGLFQVFKSQGTSAALDAVKRINDEVRRYYKQQGGSQ